MHVHADELYWVDADGLERSVMKHEVLPHFFTWLGFVHGKLHGVGWEGDDRAVFAREGAGRWTKVVVVPKAMGAPDGVFPLDDGRLGLVLAGAIFAVDEGTSLRPIPIDDLLPRPPSKLLVVASEGPTEASVAAPASPIEPVDPAQMPSPAQPSMPTQPSNAAQPTSPGTPIHVPEPQVAREAIAEPRASRVRVQHVLRVAPDRYALVVGEGYGSAETLILLGGGRQRVVRCDILRVRRAIGVIEAKDGTVYVPTSRASVVEIRADGACGEPQVPLLPDE